MSVSQVVRLPVELILRIGSFLPFIDRLQLSSTNSHMRQTFVPDLFYFIRATNRDEDWRDIQHVVAKHGQHVRGMHFQCHLYQNSMTTTEDENKDCDYARTSNEHGTLPEEAAKLLSGAVLDQLHAITVQYLPQDDFEGSEWGDEENLGLICIHDTIESDEQVQQQEDASLWRKVMAQIWDSLSTNSSVLYLEILDLPPRRTTTWQMSKWHNFLSQLQKLSIDVWGSDDGAGWHSNTTFGYLDFLSRLDEYFFNHCSNLVHLEIVADSSNLYGCEGFHHAPLALRTRCVPNLQVLELRSCIIDLNLVHFLKARYKKLKQLILADCTSCFQDRLTNNAISWADLFREIFASKPVLDSLLVTNFSVPLTQDEQFSEEDMYIPPDNEPDHVKAIRESCRAKGRKLFSYIYIDDKYGMIFAEEELNISRFEDGEDQREYDNLMTLINQNAFANTQVEAPSEGVGEGKLRPWRTDRVLRSIRSG